MTSDDPASVPDPGDPRRSFTSELAVRMLDLPSHRHGGGRSYVAFDDVVRLVHELDAARP